MEYRFSDRIKDLNGAATREILKLTSRPEVISFAGGMPATQCLPCAEVREIADAVLSGDGAASILQYGQTEGVKAFNEQMIKYLGELGIETDLGGIQVVSGGQQGIDLMLKAFINKGDTILVENPTYLAFLQIAKTYEANVVGVDADDDGLILSDLERKLKKYSPKILYVVPTFSNPTGKTYSAKNRKAIAELCDKYGTVVLEDDPYGRLRYDGQDVPPLKTFDKSGTVAYLTSFSKTIAPGLRVAVICGDPKLIRKVSIGKQGADVQTTALGQMIVAEYLKRGYFYPNLEKSKAVYKTRKDAMLAALDKYMPKEVKYTRPNGGLFIWVELPYNIDAAEMFGDVIAKNVAYIVGNEFYVDGSGKNTLRLNFSNSDPERIERGIKILGETVAERIKEKRANG